VPLADAAQYSLSIIGPMTRLARSLGVRPGEGRLIAIVAAVFAAIEVGRGFGETAADSLVISRLGQESLPWLFIGDRKSVV